MTPSGANDMVIRAMGERAFLVEVGSLDAVLALHARLEASRPEGVVDLVPAARTVLVRVDPRVFSLAAARAWALSAPEQEAHRGAGAAVELPIFYDGPDLAEVAGLLGVSADELVRRHQGVEWAVAFTGFAPGFGYLVSPDWPWDVPRLAQPRTRVPAGAVGLAAGFTGAYPRETPGGWRLIGTTPATLFDPDAATPALLAPGTRVRFKVTPSPVYVGVGGATPSAGSGHLAEAGRSAPDLPASPGSGDLAEAGRFAPVDPASAGSGDLAEAGGSAPVDPASPGSGGLAEAGRFAPNRPASAGSGDLAEAGRSAPDLPASAGSGHLAEAGRSALDHPASAGSGDLAEAGRSALDRPASAGCPDLGATGGTQVADDAVRDAAAGAARSIRIVEPGLLATLQDLGRPGAAALGVSVSGAFDRTALRTANRLVGNLERAAAIEVTMGGLRARADADAWFAVTGAWGRILLDGREVDPYEAHPWRAGAELHLDWFAHGARAYLAVRGGFTPRAVLDSLSTDLLAGLGPAPLAAGDAVPIGESPRDPIPVAALAPWGAPPDDLVLELAPGPRADWFTASALSTLFETSWTVGAAADRVGVRLEGPALDRSHTGELPSEGMVAGAIQVPPDGRPVILCADGPVTGGYPVIAVVTDAALDLLAQARPGTRIRFRHARSTV